MAVASPKEFLVIASHPCDIAKDSDSDPSVVVLRAFVTKNERLTKAAATNSSRHFLLDPDRGLVADACWIALLEKPVLLAFESAPGAIDDLTRARFANWLGRRFNRPALPDDVVRAVVAPVVENLRQMQSAEDPLLGALESVFEIRLLRITGAPPFSVRLVVIVEASLDTLKRAEIASLLGRIHGWLDPSVARLVAAEVRTHFEISVGDYIQTDQIFLDEFTYRGTTIAGLRPPSAA